MHPAGQTPEACQKPDASCVKVVYRVPEDNIECSWIVGFVRGAPPAPGEKVNVHISHGGEQADFVSGVHPVILDEDENAAKYTFRKSWRPGEVQPLAIDKLFPDYPPIARAAHVEGEVVVEVVVDPNGVVQVTKVLSGPPMLQSSAVTAAQQWRFQPMLVGDKHVSFRTELRFDFNGAAVFFGR
jgi:TonB family protein